VHLDYRGQLGLLEKVDKRDMKVSWVQKDLTEDLGSWVPKELRVKGV